MALYQLGSILASALTGIVAARLGPRLAMTIGAWTYAVGCALSALAPDMARCCSAGCCRAAAA